MARMYPAKPRDFHGSKGEERVFRALKALPDDVVVLHSFRWVHPGRARIASKQFKSQGEGDFVVFDPSRGILVLEVKGGEIWCQNGEWLQRNRKTGEIQQIEPEAQASETMFRIRDELTFRIPETKKLLFCHAVWFPDQAIDKSNLPFNYHQDMTLDGEDIARAELAIRRAFNFWKACLPARDGAHPDTVQRITAALAPSLSFVRSVRQTLDEREALFVELTREQSRILDFLDEQAHAAIVGAAGTGKTLLAVEKARRLASPTEPVLFLCFNAALRDHLNTHHSQPNVSYLTFHGLARRLIGQEGSLDEAEAGLLEHLSDDRDLPYDHVVIDEAQDFKPDWLEFLRYRFRERSFYAFYDRHQVIQRKTHTEWLDDIPCRLVLTRNCRNTDPIARVAYRSAGLRISPTLGITGPRPVLHRLSTQAEAVERAETLIRGACEQHHTPAHEIALLTLDTLDPGDRWIASRLAGKKISQNPEPNTVTVTTVRRFKGLEAALVIIVDVDFRRFEDEEWRRRLYVACSRARQAVHLFTTNREEDLATALPLLSDTPRVRLSWRALERHLGVRLGGKDDDPFQE